MRGLVGAILIVGLGMSASAVRGEENRTPAKTEVRSRERTEVRPSAKSEVRERTTDADIHRLLKLEDDWTAGLAKRDGALFNKLLAKGFIYTEDDHTIGREALLRELTKGSDRVASARNERMRIHPFGSTAVVTGWLVVRGQGKQGSFDRKYRFTDTWVRRDGDWQIAAAHDYVLPHGAR